jgi:hypothetical protein
MRRFLVVAALLCAGCPATPTDNGRMPPPLDTTYPDGAAGLTQLWRDILTAAIKDDRERVHVLMASTIMSDDDLNAVFGPDKGKMLQPRYLPMISTLVNIGSMEMIAQISDRKYDDVEVFQYDDVKGTDAEKATLKALATPIPVYGVRIKRKGQPLGSRYDFYIYRNGHWVTGNQLAKYLVEPREGQVAVQPPAPPATAAHADGGSARK